MGRKKPKTEIKFDENARREWLNGFSKRKKARKQTAKDALVEELKAEKNHLRAERRTMQRKSDQFLERLEDTKQIIQEKTKEYKCAGKTVEITECNANDDDGILGHNRLSDSDSEESGTGSEHSDNAVESHSAEVEPTADHLPKKPPTAVTNLEQKLFKINHKKDLQRAKRRRKRNTASGVIPAHQRCKLNKRQAKRALGKKKKH